MKQVLILGGSGGIGSACVRGFQDRPEFQVTSVRRKNRETENSQNVISGDLCLPEFRRQLVRQTSPQIVISAFGQYPSDECSVSDAINEFAISVIDLFEAFEAKGGLEHFVVVSSLSAQTNALPFVFMNTSTHKYICAKRMLSDFFRQTQLHMKSKSKITVIEPGFVRTGFANIEARLANPSKTDVLTRTQIEPIDPAVVATAILHAVSDSTRPSSSLTFYNSVSSR